MSMADRDGFIWYDGKLVPGATPPPMSSPISLHYGMGVSRRAAPTRPTPAPPSSASKNIPTGCSIRPHLPDGHALRQGHRQQAQRSHPRQPSRIRLPAASGLLRFGKAGRSPRCEGPCRHRRLALGRLDWAKRPQRASASRLRASPATMSISPWVRAKACGHYHQLDPGQQRSDQRRLRRNHAADRKATSPKGPGNLFIVKKGKIYTPDLTSCLEGIPRHRAATGRGTGPRVLEKRITRDEVYTADEAFFTGTPPK